MSPSREGPLFHCNRVALLYNKPRRVTCLKCCVSDYTVDGSVRNLIMLNYFAIHNMYMAPTWSWSYGSWIYNYMYLCNQCLSPLKLWVRTQLRESVLDTTLFNIKSLSVTWGWSVFSQGTLVSSTNKTNRHDITGIFLKVAINTITLTHNQYSIPTVV